MTPCELDGRQYLVTEFVDGGTLRDWIRAGPRPWQDVVELVIGVADGLATAHDAGILHRDIKPENILVTKTGYAKLAYFGLAKLCESPSLSSNAVTVTRTDQGGLWVADVETGRRQRLVPDFELTHYSISGDGQRVVFVAVDEQGRRRCGSHRWTDERRRNNSQRWMRRRRSSARQGRDLRRLAGLLRQRCVGRSCAGSSLAGDARADAPGLV